MNGRATSVVLAGVAGQPVVTTARLLAEAAVQAGHDASFAEVPSALECGGPIWAHVRFGPEARSALVGERRADVLLGFEQLEALRASHLLAPHGFAAVSELLVPTWRMRAGLEPAPDVIARLAALTPRVAPVPIECLVQPRGREPCAGLFLLGLVSPLLPLPEDAYLAVFRASSRVEADACRLAFARGRDWFASLPERVTAAALQPLDIAGERR